MRLLAAASCLLLVLMAGCAKAPPGTGRADADAIPEWSQTYVQLLDAGDAAGLSRHISETDQDGHQAAAHLASVPARQGWAVDSTEVTATGVSDQERNVKITVTNRSGERREIHLLLTWTDKQWVASLRS